MQHEHPAEEADVGSTRGKGATGTGSGSSGTMIPRTPPMNRVLDMSYAAVVARSSSISTGDMLQKKVAAVSSRGMPTTLLPGKGKAGMGLCCEEMPQKKATALSAEYPALGAPDRKTTSRDCGESAAAKHSRTKKRNTLTRANIAQKNRPQDRFIKDERVHELELFIQELNDQGKGEDISNEEFVDYYERLPSGPGWIDLEDSLEDEEFDRQADRHALYRLRYYKHKFKQQAAEEELHGDKLEEGRHLSLLNKSEDDCNKEFLEEIIEKNRSFDKLKEDRHLSLLHKSEDDCTEEFLEEEGLFRRFEEDETFDWFFHRDYAGCSSLDDYQCIVLKNYYGTEYTRWSVYHKYLHSYEIELEYVKYFEELTKQLKWMEDYVDTDWPAVKWNSVISSRGVYQAVKIAATSFHKITPTLAYNGFFECKEDMVYDYTFYKDLDGVYFEIWRRITHGMKSFKEALEEVYNLNRFLARQHIMKAALEFDDAMKMMEREFRTCTSAITPEVEDRAQELILEAVKKRVNEPKSYEQYIRKKMEIARIIGILDPKESR